MTEESQSPSPPPSVVYAYPPDLDLKGGGGIDLRELWNVLWAGKWVIIATTLLFAIAAVFIALSLPNVYRSSALLAPSDEAQGGGISKMAGQLGGLASLAGINLGAGEGTNKVAVALEVLRSRKFVTNFIEKHNILPELMAAEEWNRATGDLIFNPELYNPANGQWVREVDPPKTPKPSAWEAYEAFIGILGVSQSDETGFVTISVEHYSPHIAQNWASLLVDDLNATMKEEDVSQAQRSIGFLNSQIEKVALAEMRTVFYQLIEEQIQTMMLAEVREEYIFSTIDPPVVPEEKSKPNRPLICVLITMLGGMFGVLIVFILKFFRTYRSS